MAKKTTQKKTETCKDCELTTKMIVPKVVSIHGRLAKRLWPMRFK